MRRLILALPLVLAVAAPALADDPEVSITLKDHQFTPSEVPVPAGVKVKVTVKNEQPTTAEFESRVLHFEKIVTAGGQIAVFVGPLNPGSYEFYDDFHHDTRGHLVVKQ
jgi:plastocyanin